MSEEEDRDPDAKAAAGSGAWEDTVAAGAFPQTQWTMVYRAAGEGTVASNALEVICRDYWYPLYAFVRRQGNSTEDARDLTQGFFEYLLRGEYLARADRDKGRLRSYLLGAIKHYMLYEWRKASAQKRGGGKTAISIDAEEGEDRFKVEPAEDPDQSPDKLFERRWALTMLETVMKRLEKEQADKDKGDQFKVLGPFLAWNSGEETYAEAGEKIGLKEGAVKVAVHRMRQRYGELLREEIAQTVSSPEGIQDEIEFLLAALR